MVGIIQVKGAPDTAPAEQASGEPVIDKTQARGAQARPAAELDPNATAGQSASKVYQEALFLACRQGHASIVEALLNEGRVDPAVPDENGHTALHMARENGHPQVVQRLQRCDSDKAKEVAVKALLELAPLSRTTRLPAALVVPARPVNAPPVHDRRTRDARAAKVLMALGGEGISEEPAAAQVEPAAAQSGASAEVASPRPRALRARPQAIRPDSPQAAALSALPKNIRAALQQNDPAKKSSPEQNALISAARAGNLEEVRRLLAAGQIEAGRPNDTGDHALGIAAWYGRNSIVEELAPLQHNGEPLANHPGQHQRFQGWTPLHYAAFKGQTRCVEVLLAN